MVMSGSIRVALCAALILLFQADAPARAAVLTESSRLAFSGSLGADDDIAFHDVELAAPFDLRVAFESFSYAGGTLGDGTSVPSGGFDPILSLFDREGRLLGVGDDGLRRRDPVSGDPYDAFLSLSLAPGEYRLAVTQYDNLPNASLGGFLSEGFSRTGEGNFTAGLCSALSFCDSGGYSRTAQYVVEVATLSSIPVPAPLGLLLAGAALLGGVAARRSTARN
jgi:hypothetical protein